MRARALKLAGFAVLAVLLLVPGPAQAGKRVPKTFFGVDSIHRPPAAEFDLMRSSGVDVFRAPMIWRSIERDPPVEMFGQTHRTYDWSETDLYMQHSARSGVRLQFGITGTPAWVDRDIATSPMRSAAGRQGWTAFVAAVVSRYGRGGDFWDENPGLTVTPPITYQLWNEQNTTARYKPRPDVAEYAKLLELGGREIRAREPGAEIVPGGMFGTPKDADSSIKAWKFAKRLLKHPDARRYIDAIAIHPYSPDVRGVRYQFKKMRRVLVRAGRGDMPIHVTEIGWSSGAADNFFLFKGPKGQARMLKRSFAMMLKRRRDWNLERLVWFMWRDVARDEVPPGCGFCPKMGLLFEDLEPKRSHNAFVQFSNAPR